MREQGVAALSLREVARRVRMQAPSLYAYFPSKMALYDALFLMGVRMRAAYRDRADAGRVDFWDRLEGRFESYMRFAQEHPELYQLAFERPALGSELDETLSLIRVIEHAPDDTRLGHAFDHTDCRVLCDVRHVAKIFLGHPVAHPEDTKIVPESGLDAVPGEPGVERPVKTAMATAYEIAKAVLGLLGQILEVDRRILLERLISVMHRILSHAYVCGR